MTREEAIEAVRDLKMEAQNAREVAFVNDSLSAFQASEDALMNAYLIEREFELTYEEQLEAVDIDALPF